MKDRSRNQVSSYAIIKGAMIEETYAVFAAWDFSFSKRKNLDHLRTENIIGAKSVSWLRDVAKVVSGRFEPDTHDCALVELVQKSCALDEWTPLLLWHITRNEFLFRDFLINWLFPAYDAGVFRLRPGELTDFLLTVNARGGITEHAWSETTLSRVAAGLLKMAVDFGLLRGSGAKEFATYHLSDRSFLYVLHAMYETTQSPQKIISAPDWRMFLMRPADVEYALLRLHQFRMLDYQVAGSLMQLTLPCTTAREYAERMVA